MDAVGFVHGVMNTDNMTISGETIDYGPCAFLDAHDADTVFSSIDSGGRYRYGNQPLAAQWNLARLAEALLPLVDDDAEAAIPRAVAVLETFLPRYEAAWTAGMRAKLGLRPDADPALVTDLQALLDAGHPDHTGVFRALGRAARGDVEPCARWCSTWPGSTRGWGRWRAAGPDADAMDRVNPAYVPRNHLVQEALDAATAGDLGPVDALVEVLRHPYDERRARSGTPPPAGRCLRDVLRHIGPESASSRVPRRAQRVVGGRGPPRTAAPEALSGSSREGGRSGSRWCRRGPPWSSRSHGRGQMRCSQMMYSTPSSSQCSMWYCTMASPRAASVSTM